MGDTIIVDEGVLYEVTEFDGTDITMEYTNMSLTGGVGPRGPEGPAGPAGPAGKDGNVAFDSLTAAQKEQLRGEPGADGETPVKGVDYYTEADKAEMVEDVLAALPTMKGVLF